MMIAIQDTVDDLEFSEEHLQMLLDLNNMIVTPEKEKSYSLHQGVHVGKIDQHKFMEWLR